MYVCMYVWLDHVCMYVCVRCDQGGQGHWKAHTRVQGCLSVRTDERAPRSQVGQGRAHTYIHTCGIGVLTMYVCMYYRARVALTGLAIAEYFRDQEGQGAYLHTYLHTYIHIRLLISQLPCMYVYVCVCMADVLLFVDNIFRFTQAGSEVSALLGRIPSAVG